jgi:hypothetical protein
VLFAQPELFAVASGAVLLFGLAVGALPLLFFDYGH